MTPAELVAELADETEEEILLADGFEAALLGYLERFGMQSIAVYDKRKCLEILQEGADGMTPEEAAEYFDFNVIGAWMGNGTPAFLVLPDDAS
jgi:hypothetical protein